MRDATKETNKKKTVKTENAYMINELGLGERQTAWDFF